MSSSILETEEASEDRDERLGGQMSFLEHLDELRRRLIRSAIFIFVALLFCWFFSGYIYNFLSVPVKRALAEAQRRTLEIGGLTGGERILPLASLKEGDAGRYVFGEATKLGASLIPPGASVLARYALDNQGRPGLFTDEPLFTGGTVIPKGVRLPVYPDAKPGALAGDKSVMSRVKDFVAAKPDALAGDDPKLVVRTAIEPFSLYLKVALYAAVCLSVPFLLWQVWSFIAPGLYPHERRYAMPFVVLSSISFVIGAAFAYYVLFPPAVSYLLGIGQDFQLLLNASDYFDFIILIMLAMGGIFQMPAITYVLSRIGLVTAGLLLKIWKMALIVILIAAAVLSPTSDVLNMMLFAAPMMVLYVVSIAIAWIFGKPREVS